MKHRIVIFIHALTIVLLQLIPNTIIAAAGVPGGDFYYHESFMDMLHLWGMGILWSPPVTVFSFISLCFAFVLLKWDRQWSKIVILSISILSVLLMLISIIGMIRDPNQFSVVLVIVFVLLISESIFSLITIIKII